MILVLGASGFIGSHIYSGLKESSFPVVGTCFSHDRPESLYFDLCNMDINDLELDFKRIRYLIISAALHTKIDDSKRCWAEAYPINVGKVNRIVSFCFQNDVIPVYISTDNVFDGVKGCYKEEDERRPINCYGRIRNEVENFLLDSGRPFVILRMGKVFGTDVDDGTLITAMIDILRRKRRIDCAMDQVFTPVHIGELTEFASHIIARGNTGIFHVASLKPTTRYEIAVKIVDYFGFKDTQVCSCKINSLGLLEKRPELIDLDITKYKEITGRQEKHIEAYLQIVERKEPSLSK
jgi:dTDP-4-dehydrorhamnose reductase